MIQMPLAEYLADPCEQPSLDSSTAWKLITRSPRHAWHAHPRLNTLRTPDDGNSAMDIGAAAHAIFLEGDDSRLVVIEADDWRTKAAKEQRDAAREDGNIPLLTHQRDEVMRIADASRSAVVNCKEIDGLFDVDLGAIAEQVCLWREGETWCRARPDMISGDRKYLLNYKTTGASAAPNRFGAMMVRDGYHIQAYHHARGIAAESGAMPTCLWLAQETDPPYAASVVGASPALMELAAAQWRFAVATWQQCLKADEWPAYPTRVCWIEPKAWELEQWGARPDVSGFDASQCLCSCGSRVDLQQSEYGVKCGACRAKLEEAEKAMFG